MTKLSDIKINDLFFKANKEDINKIVFEDKCLLNTENLKKHYDIGIIFGGTSMIPNRVEKGIELYREGYIDKLVVSGGVGLLSCDRKIPEAMKMEKYLLENGIPKLDIVTESQSRNTVENVQNIFNTLTSEYKNPKHLRYILITSDFHVRRCLGLFTNELEFKEKIIGCGVQDGITDINNWQNSIIGKKQILTEALLLCKYAKQRKLDDIEINDLSFSRRIK